MKKINVLFLLIALMCTFQYSCVKRTEAVLNQNSSQKVYLKTYTITEGTSTNTFIPIYNASNQVTSINNNGDIITCNWINTTTWVLTYPSGDRIEYSIPLANGSISEENRMPTVIKIYYGANPTTVGKLINITQDGAYSAVKNSNTVVNGASPYHIRDYNIINQNQSDLITDLTGSGTHFKRKYVITTKPNKIINSCRELYWFLMIITKTDLDDYAMSPIWQGLFLPKSVEFSYEDSNAPGVWNSLGIQNLAISYDPILTNYPINIAQTTFTLQHSWTWESR